MLQDYKVLTTLLCWQRLRNEQQNSLSIKDRSEPIMNSLPMLNANVARKIFKKVDLEIELKPTNKWGIRQAPMFCLK